ncbi:DUF3800 domain-containing protein [Pseudomonas savastanoi]|uniref:DUF3800 domain-containing protein n=1 Tax=Pseudomonas savastanoi TaxID=29438 RepID=UPI0007E8B9E8|nr:DUF3800 domain-containing protein [Pseudomonas savastanoi]
MGQNSQARRQAKINKANNAKKRNQARLNHLSTITPQLFLDESGHTGHNLTDLDQPIFTLAGTVHSAAEAEKLLKLLNCKSPFEAHFKKLKKTKSGREGIAKFVNSPLINFDCVKVDLVNKDYFITGKIVDLLVETMLHARGVDLYINGQNIALANMLHYCMPQFCGQENVVQMQQAFVLMIRDQTEAQITQFYDMLERMKLRCSYTEFHKSLDLILDTRDEIADILTGIDKSALDPSIPAFFSQCVLWGNIYKKGFHIIHDDSKSIERQRESLNLFMDLRKKTIEVGYDRRKFKLPIKGLSFNFAGSHEHAQIQVADIISSATSYWAGCKAKGQVNDELYDILDNSNIPKLVSKNSIWPSTNISPAELKTVYSGGLNPANSTANFLISDNLT